LTVDGDDQGENKAKLTRTFIIDRTPPKATLDTPKSGEYFGGAKNIIDITGAIVEKNLARYSLRYGSGEAPTEWKELLGANSIPADSKLFSLKAGKADTVADGAYTISLYARDKAGLEGEARVKIIIDNTPPDVSITSPKDGDYVTKPIDIKGTLSDANLESGTLELAQGSCSTAVNWAFIKTITASVTGGPLDTWKVLPSDGEYCLRVKAADKSGNKAEAKAGFKIDTHPPAAPQLSGKINNKVDGALSWTKNSEPDLAGYNLYRNNQRINTALLSDISYLDAALKEGTYSYTVKAVDFAGNESDPSNNVTLKIDLAGPTVRISSPVNGAVISNLVDIKGTAYSQDDFKEYRVYTGQGSTPSAWALIRRSPLPITFGVLAQLDTITLQEGAQYSIKLEGEDLSGNLASAQIIVTIDNTPPAQTVLLTAKPNGVDVALAWRANSEPDLAGYLLYRNYQLANVSGIVVGNLKPYLLNATTYADKGLPDGKQTYYLVAMDQAGNTSDQSNAIDVEIETHRPHTPIAEPIAGTRLGTKTLVRAESPDTDIISVQFLFKKLQDNGWSNLGAPVTKTPYITYFDPKALNLTFGDYQLMAVAADKVGPDPSPTPITITYADVTPPAVPVGLSVKVRGSDATLNWTADSEPDLDGYNLYRLLNGDRTKVNSLPLKTTSYPDTGLADGTYQYELTAIDTSSNESNASGRVTAIIYAPVITQPFSPVKEPTLTVNGSNAALNASVEITSAPPSGDAAKAAVNADSSGSFTLAGLTLSPGKNRISAIATDRDGNVSRSSEQVVVTYGAPPAPPTGLVATVQNYDVQLSWNINSEPDIIGYNLFRDGNKLNAPVAVTGGVASASYEDNNAKARYAIDGNTGNYWGTQYAYGTFMPAWWQISIPQPVLINHLNIRWGLGDWDYTNNRSSICAGKDYEIQAWSGYNWITLQKVAGNDQQINTIDITPSYRTDRIRIAISSTADPNDSKYVRIDEITFQKDNLVPSPAYSDSGLKDGRYVYMVTAVNGYGFESNPSSPANAVVGDVIPPAAQMNLKATAQGSNVLLDWSLTSNTEPDLAGYNVYRQNGTDWVSLGNVPASASSYTDIGLPNSTYTYHITAYDQVGNESAPSNPATATIAVSPPPVPPQLTITAPPEGKALVASWQLAGGTTAGYNLYRSITQGGQYQRITPNPIQSLTYRDEGLLNGTRYYYVVAALDAQGNEGSYSNDGNGMPRDLVAPDRPLIFSPALPGAPLTVYRNSIAVSGFAEPGSTVELMRGGDLLGTTAALIENSNTTKAIDVGGNGMVISPDGAMLAYSDNNGTLWLKDLSTGLLTSIDNSGWSAVWSPNGKKVAYSMYDSSGNTNRIKVYDLDSAKSSFLTDDTGVNESLPNWSGDGSRMAFQSNRSSAYGVWLKNLIGNSLVQLADNVNVSNLSLSPDASRIAYFNNQNLLVINIAAGKVSQLDDNTDQASITWAPDNGKVAFISYRDGDAGMFVTDLTALATNKILSYPGSDFSQPAWSPDGTKIVYSQDENYGSSLHIIGLNGEQATLLDNIGSINPLSWAQSGEITFIEGNSVHLVKLKGTFTVPKVQLAAGENQIYAVASDDSGNASPPSDSITVVFETGLLPDLVITDSDITLFPPYPKPGEDVLVTARVNNPTSIAVDNATVALYLWDGSNDVTLLKSETIQHLDANGEGSVSVGFNAGTAIGARTIIAVADPDNFVAEVLETNNNATKELTITDQQRVSVEIAISSSQYGANQDAIIGVTLRNSGAATSGNLNVMVEDSSGNLVKLLSSQPQDLPYGLDRKLSFTWNTGTTYSGSYKAHAVVKDGNGMETLAEHGTPFGIVADLQASGSVTTDKQAYGSGELVIISVNFTNSGANNIIPQLKTRVRIVDSQNNGLFSDEKTFANLLPSMGGGFTSAWNTGMSPAGAYTVFVDISAGDQLLTSKSAAFSITPQPLLKGALSVNPTTVAVGGSFTATYNISNKGNSAFAGTVGVSLLDPGSQAIAASFEQPATILQDGSLSGEFNFSSQGLQLKLYLVNLWHDSQGTRKNLASAGITISDVTPPLLTLVSPTTGTTYNATITIAALASDDASGVDRVEYQLDSGAWKLLPIADPAGGRYAVTWEPALVDNGPHTMSFRALDRAKNQSNPVSVTFSFDSIPPTGSIIINNGATLTNSTQVQLLLSATDTGGVAKMRLSSDGETWTDPEAYSSTRQWQLTSGDGTKQVYVKFMDNAGNWSQAVNAGITLDATPPTVSASPADGIYNKAQNVTLTASEPAIINYTTDGAVPGSESAVYDQAISITANTSLKFIARDSAGNKSPVKTETYIIDMVPPVLTVSTLRNGSYTNQEILNISGTATDDNSGIKDVQINGISVPVNSEGSFSYAMQPQTGANTITVTATDLAGNQASDTRTIILDQMAPVLVVTAPADNSKTGMALTHVTGSVDDVIATVTVTLGNTTQTALLTGNNFQASVILAPKVNTIEITATDLAMNTSSQKRTVFYDDQKPSLAITAPNQDIHTNKSSLTIQGTASDPFGLAVTVSMTMDGQTYNPALVNGQFEQVVTFTTQKSYAIVVTATNEVGSSTSAQRNVIYDITPPALTINPVTSPTSQPNQVVTGTMESGTPVTVTCPTATVGTVTYPTATTWSVNITNMTLGDNAITATATDLSNNTTTASADIVYKITQTENTFDLAVFGNTGVTMSGGSYTDSFISTPPHIIRGQYKHGDVGTNSVHSCAINMSGGTEIFGKAWVGFGGNPATGICLSCNSTVYNKITGSLTSAKDMTPKTDPAGGTWMGALKLSGHTAKSLSSGNYRYSSITLSGGSKLTLSGTVMIHIDGDLTVSGGGGGCGGAGGGSGGAGGGSGGSSIVIASGSVTIYANGKKIDFSGGSLVNNTQNPKNLTIYGTARLQRVNLSGGSDQHLLLYAPTATITLSGGQNTFGSIIGSAVNLSGGSSVHYDEVLAH
jgi:hypothetical protein